MSIYPETVLVRMTNEQAQYLDELMHRHPSITSRPAAVRWLIDAARAGKGEPEDFMRMMYSGDTEFWAQLSAEHPEPGYVAELEAVQAQGRELLNATQILTTQVRTVGRLVNQIAKVANAIGRGFDGLIPAEALAVLARKVEALTTTAEGLSRRTAQHQQDTQERLRKAGWEHKDHLHYRGHRFAVDQNRKFNARLNEEEHHRAAAERAETARREALRAEARRVADEKRAELLAQTQRMDARRNAARQQSRRHDDDGMTA